MNKTITYELSDAMVEKAILDYINKHERETYDDISSMSFLNGSVVEKPCFTHVSVEVKK
jgi:tRNA(Leu) C34 or U34 (ribose-2'-O)-methylase TrmL